MQAGARHPGDLLVPRQLGPVSVAADCHIGRRAAGLSAGPGAVRRGLWQSADRANGDRRAGDDSRVPAVRAAPAFRATGLRAERPEVTRAVDKIRIALANRGAGTAPVFATVEGGYFREQGRLEPELILYQGHSRSLAALIAGEADFTNAVGQEVIMANRRHQGDAVIIASATSRSAQQVSARPGLTTREQLRGKRWGIVARNDADEGSIAMAFERWGWDRNKDAEIVVVGSDRPRLDLLLDERRVDVAIMHAPEPFQAAKRGWTMVEDLGRLDSCAATTRRLMRQRPDTALRYVRAYCRGGYHFSHRRGVLNQRAAQVHRRDRCHGARADLAVVRPPDGRDDGSQWRAAAAG